MHIRITAATKDATTVKTLASIYTNRWPNALQFKLFLAAAKLELGESVDGMELMRMCAARDVAGQVSKRIWGPQHMYAPIWSDDLQINFAFPIPADIATRLGCNHLPAVTEAEGEYLNADDGSAHRARNVQRQAVRKGERKLPLQHAEIGSNPAFKSVENAFAELSKKLKKPSIQKSDGRFPVYVICSSLDGLTKKYGSETALMIYQEARRLSDLIGKKAEWNSLVYYPDDLNSIKNLEVPNVNGEDPWELKL